MSKPDSASRALASCIHWERAVGLEPALTAIDPTLALRDRRGRPLSELRLSIIDRCNYRCPYCMPAEQIDEQRDFLAPADRLTAAEIERLVRSFVRLGVRKLRLTGGEPLLRPDLIELVQRLARIEALEDLALTTNGSLLERRAVALRRAGLHRLTVSLDALDPAIFRQMSGGRGDVAQVLAGIEAAERAGFESQKINCVVQRGLNDDQVLPLVRHFRATRHVLRFIEFMDVGTLNHWSADAVVSAAELRARIAAEYPLRELPAIEAGVTASRYLHADGQGELGFVASVSAPFCGDCGRARVTADGQLYTCLFGSRGIDLRSALRTGAGEPELAGLIGRGWRNRDDRYSEQRAELGGKALPVRVQMYAVGG
jgi:cyclic pyranopterin phosphate synthase